MIVIRACKIERSTGNPVYKEYHATCGLKAEMSIFHQDRDNTDIIKYTPLAICDIWNTDED